MSEQKKNIMRDLNESMRRDLMGAQTEAHSDKIDLHTGRRSYEGEHRVTIVSRDLPWNAELLVDGQPVRNAKRIEIDIDCEKALQLVKLTSAMLDDDGKGKTRVTNLVTELTANALNVTIEDAVCVEMILEKARKEAMSNAQATQLFAITDEDEHGEKTTFIVSELIRDAYRYRALRRLIQEENDAIDLHTAQVHNQKPYDENGFDQVADELRAGQAEQRRNEAEWQEIDP